MTTTRGRRREPLAGSHTEAVRSLANKIVADARLREASLAGDRAQFDALFDELLRELFPGLKVRAVKGLLGDVHTTAFNALRSDELQKPVEAKTPRDRRSTRIISAAAQCLPSTQRERWVEEWAAEWQDMASAPRRTRWAFLTRLLLRTGPKLAWVLRVQQRREAA
ncbi:hypothetical protein [Streptomyces sp. NPDC059071]|uniref:hypothetical protein n=1 Tax=unclassified Streptomyces TaxID=2593676 RepID=UPI0036662651